MNEENFIISEEFVDCIDMYVDTLLDKYIDKIDKLLLDINDIKRELEDEKNQSFRRATLN